MKAQFSLFAPAEPSIEGIDVALAFASCSCQNIGESGTIRRPVPCNGDLWIATGTGGTMALSVAEMYRVVPLDEFDGEPTTYSEKISVVRPGDRWAGDYARNDPNGFYHGVAVKYGGAKYILCGPPLELSAPRPTFDDSHLFEEDAEQVEADEPYPCTRCGINLCQLDEYEELEEGPVCPECLEADSLPAAV